MASTTCGWCGRLTHMTLVGEVFEIPESYQLGPERGDLYAAAFRCDSETCARLSIGQARLHFAGYPGMQELKTRMQQVHLTWTPQSVSRPAFPDVPDQIASAASEAHACLSIQAYRGAVALARAVVEATAKDHGIVRGSLASKINELGERNLIREFTRQLAHEIREGGNEIAHGDLADEPMPPEDAEAIIGLMDEILQEVYQAPAKMLRLKKSREEREQRNAAQAAEA
ncbi:DUF4145 domain-containing protein [Streptomyces jeddahensis]|uniref:DUF4145 domain-containing protein n=1 Tax=Streptomyces jeddahensis TaxID=1716141 RepID=A0A177HIT8_9ACTN|nr:DUF4145 domain-containing protein [Streptomyces jeddahensis]OAH10873.1 hypothetical protein STSP_57150 [Streptomyces jeddahensis]